MSGNISVVKLLWSLLMLGTFQSVSLASKCLTRHIPGYLENNHLLGWDVQRPQPKTTELGNGRGETGEAAIESFQRDAPTNCLVVFVRVHA